MSNKLQAKDLINLGLFTVLYFVIGCCVAIPIGFVPIFLPILGALWSLITGIPFMLFLTRVKKFGMVTIMGILSGLLMGLTGMGFWGVPMGLIFGLLGDLILKSGGEKQKIACAGVSIMEPDVLVMDEPSSNLDASSILDLRAILAFWKSQGKTIIVSEHRLYYLRGLADRFIYITGGKVEKDYSAAEFESLTEQQRAKLGLRTFILEDLLPPKALPQAGQQMELRNFCFAYKNEPETLHIRESKIPANRIVGIIGNNGAGKSTFSRCFCGLEKRCGEVIWNGRTYRPKDRLNTCYMVMQEVNHQLFTETVLDEVLISMEEENQERAEEILAELDLIDFKDRHPMSLSGGQKQRVAIASAIASKRSILFFDEPTSGLDYKHMKEVANVLKQVRDAGITLYVITHDLELLLDCCTDIVHFEGGSIIDQFQMDEAGLEKIRNYFIKGVSAK